MLRNFENKPSGITWITRDGAKIEQMRKIAEEGKLIKLEWPFHSSFYVVNFDLNRIGPLGETVAKITMHEFIEVVGGKK